MSSGKKGLLPEPSLAQLLSSLGNPAALQVLLRPYQAGASKRGGERAPFLPPTQCPGQAQFGRLAKCHISFMEES